MAERSRAYPSYNLEDCIENAKKIREALGKGKHGRESMAEAMGFSPKNADVNRRISSMVQFGLLVKHTKENAYSLNNDNIDRITHPKNPLESSQALKELFLSPQLYKELTEKYESDGQIPKQLEIILYRDHGIIQSSSGDAARVFIESGMYAGIIDEDYKIHLGPSEVKKNIKDEDPSGQISTESNLFFSNTEPSHNKEQIFNFAVTGGKFAKLVVPVTLNSKDILIIRKQIELLELQIEE